jgi:hypothetical protein
VRAPVETATLAALYAAGLSLAEVAKVVGMESSSIRERFLRAGIERRTLSASIKLGYTSGRRISKGRPGPVTEMGRRNMSEAAKKRGERYARGVSVTTDGYLRVTRGEHKGRLLHDVLVEQSLGRPIEPHECVHHIDRDKGNNDPANLLLMTRAEHTSLHRQAALAAAREMEVEQCPVA